MSEVVTTPVIVLNWNGWDDTFACLRSLHEHGDGCPVWLVDNASRDDRRAEAAALYPGLRTFRWNDNYGWAGGYNRALRIALHEGYEYVYLLNNDCLLTPGALQSVIDVARDEPHAAAVGSYIAYAATPQWLQFDGLPRAEGERAVAGGLSTRRTRRLSGAGMLVRMRAMSECGLFDERLFCYWDDTEWCARVQEAGWYLLIAGGSLLLHQGNGSDVNFNALYYLNRNRYLVRARPELHFTPVRELRYILGNLRFAGDLRRAGRGAEATSLVAGLWDGWTGKTGRRGSDPPELVLFLLLHCRPFPSGFVQHLLDRARRLSRHDARRDAT
ncbi:MAG TPA: glycosyltransferase family 2 protein [Chloroflexota bacterium]|nr:glycosyltransferase family 2 protein [Chloroflexota bacterium]